MRFEWEEIDEDSQTDLQAFATAAMTAILKERPNVVEKAAIAETAWEMAEAMLDRRARRKFRLATEGDEPEKEEDK